MPKIHDVGAGVRMYNVSHAVGDGMPNSKDDVLLVQWMLKVHFNRADKKAMLGQVWKMETLTGTCSQELIEIIKIYQYDANLNIRGARLKLDGKIYPIQVCPGLNQSPLALLNLSVAGHSKFYKAPARDPSLYSEARTMFERCGTV